MKLRLLPAFLALTLACPRAERASVEELYTTRMLGLLPSGLGPEGETPRVSLFWSVRADAEVFRDFVMRYVLVNQRDSVIIVANTFAAREDSVFVVIGNERDLTQKGLIRREGGTLLMFGRGKTLVPGRTLDQTQFTVLSKARDTQIMLPSADKEYRIISRQALEFTDLAKPRDAIVKGTLTITDSERFWAPSKYLILVEK